MDHSTTRSAKSYLPYPSPTKSFWQETHDTEIAYHRTTKDLPQSAQVVVVGSGISGAFATRELLRHGCDVLLLEARSTCSGATGRNGGHCQPLLYSSAPEIARFELQNFYMLADVILRDKIECEYQQMNGGCHAYFSRKAFAQAKAKVLRFQEGQPELANLIRIVEDKSDLSALRVPNAVGAIVQNNAASISGYKLITSIFSELLKSGRLNLQTNTPVTSIAPHEENGTWRIHTPRGTVKARKILLTTNAYTSHLLPAFRDLIVPIQAQMSAISPEGRPREQQLSHSYYFIGAIESEDEEVQEDYLVQRPTSKGGELMFGGGRLVAKSKGYNCPDDSFNDDHAVKFLKTSLDYLLDVNDGLENASPAEANNGPTVTPTWTGIFGLSKDGHPWVGPVPQMRGIHLCAGYSGHGMPNAALCASHAAALIAAEIENDLHSSGRHDLLTKSDGLHPQAIRIPSFFLISKERMEQAMALPLGSFPRLTEIR